VKSVIVIASVLALTGCTSFPPTGACVAGCLGVPMGPVIMCVGKCVVNMAPPQTAAEKAAGVAAGLLTEMFTKGKSGR
jgi:hypothetical protein